MNAASAATASAAEVRVALQQVDPSQPVAASLQRLVRLGLDHLPMPGSGATRERWQVLAAVAEFDLSLAKLYEGHTDALAILTELHALSPGTDGLAQPVTWCVWAAESPQGRALIEPQADGSVRLNGAKFWCSGADTASHALLTAWYPDKRGPQLVRIALDQPGVTVVADGWHAVGMAASTSLTVRFDDAVGSTVGACGQYLERPGFWQGGAGIAACWLGGARGIALALFSSPQLRSEGLRAHLGLIALGKVDVALEAAGATLRETARWIDAHPRDDASEVTLRARLVTEEAARRVLDEAGRALGATPFCRDRSFARAAADLPVFIRQSHAERDCIALGERLLSSEASPWML